MEEKQYTHYPSPILLEKQNKATRRKAQRQQDTIDVELDEQDATVIRSRIRTAPQGGYTPDLSRSVIDNDLGGAPRVPRTARVQAEQLMQQEANRMARLNARAQELRHNARNMRAQETDEDEAIRYPDMGEDQRPEHMRTQAMPLRRNGRPYEPPKQSKRQRLSVGAVDTRLSVWERWKHRAGTVLVRGGFGVVLLVGIYMGGNLYLTHREAVAGEAAVQAYESSHVLRGDFGRGQETITAIVQDHRIVITEILASDPTKPRVYATGDLRETGTPHAGEIDDLDITITAQDLKGDGKIDILIAAEDQADQAVLRWTLVNQGADGFKFSGSSSSQEGGK